MKSPLRIALISVLLIAAISAPLLAGQRTRAATPPSAAAVDATARLLKAYPTAELQAGVYVGSEFCLACHKSMSTYTGTNHSSFVRRPISSLTLQPGKGVIANSLGKNVDDFIAGLDFNAVSGTVFDKYKPNAPKLSVENGTYFITVASLKMPVVLTVAGQPNGTAQRFGVRVPVSDSATGYSTSIYYGPFAYDPKLGYTYSSGWYDATTNAPKFAAGTGAAALVASGGPSNHTSGCTGCHMGGATKTLTKTPAGETAFKGYVAVLYSTESPNVIDYDNDGNFEIANIGCESCHGPGSNHILNGGDPTKIVNPKNLKPAQQSEICGRCHVTGKSLPANTYNWPLNDATGTQWTPFDAKNGTPLANFYKDSATKYPDGVLNKGARPYNDWAQSNHATFAAHTVGCPDCHDAHAEGEGRLLRESVVQGTLTIPTSAENNTLCISCHAGYGPFASFAKQDVLDLTAGKADAIDKIAKATAAHSNHPYAPQRMMGLSNCTGCHMSFETGHTFKAVSPELTLKYQDKGGMPNSCASGCHNNKVDVFGLTVKGTATTWNNPFDVNLSKALKVYFGDGGKWWDTSK
ncbi:MAG TPA: cytochrome c3 family protein, partial [Thermoanaerobaculia bacterium]|nr:cytochrome c3 family protein [Thermoanaerobaculia bacterium]